MKVLEKIVDCLIRQLVSIDNSQFGFVPGRGTTDAVFVVRHLREYLANKRLYIAFADLEKAFDAVLWKVFRWALKKLGVDCGTGAGDVCQWAEPCPCLWGYSEELEVKVWCSLRLGTQPAALHHFAWSLVMRVPLWENLYANDHGFIAESLEECVRRPLTWKEAMEEKGWVNAGKTKIMICGTGLDLLLSSRRVSCAVCRIGVGRNRIFCNGCKNWVHKKCSGIMLGKGP